MAFTLDVAGWQREEHKWWALPCGVEWNGPRRHDTSRTCRRMIECEMNLPPSNRWAGQDRAAYEHVASQLCVIYYPELGREESIPAHRLLLEILFPSQPQSVEQYDCTSTTQMYVILFFLECHCFKIISFFKIQIWVPTSDFIVTRSQAIWRFSQHEQQNSVHLSKFPRL